MASPLAETSPDRAPSIEEMISWPDRVMVRPSRVALLVAWPSGVVPVTANRAGMGRDAFCTPSRP